MSLMIESMSVAMFFIILKTTSFSLKDIGLRIKNARDTFIPDIFITLAGTAILISGKLVILNIAPGFFLRVHLFGIGAWELSQISFIRLR